MTELDHRNDPDAGTIEIFPPRQDNGSATLVMLREAAESLELAHRYATAVCATGNAGRYRGKPDDGAAAILHGGEIGLKPNQSLLKVVVINGMPGLESQTMVGLLTARGYRIRTTAQSDESVTVEGDAPNGEHATSTWTIGRATKAGYTKNEKYQTDPQAMLKAKARAEVCRELAPDVLLGLSYATEELEMENFGSSRVSSERVAPAAAGAVTVEEIMGAAAKPEAAAPKAKRKPKAKAEPAPEAPVDAEVVDDAEPAADEPTPPQQPDPIEPDPEGGPAADQVDDERGKLIRQMFALLAKGDVTDREDRLTIYRRGLKRPEIGSTNDLSDDELKTVVAALVGHDKKGDLAMWAEAILIAAVEEETAAAQAAATTTPEGE